MLDDLQWEMLVDRFHEGLCVPFLGAGVNIKSAERGYDGLPLGGLLAKRLARKVGTKSELARVALEYEVRTDRGYLVDFLEEALPDAKRAPSPALEVLATLPLKLVITTNYDRLLERALAGREFTSLVQPAAGFDDKPEIQKRLAELAHYKGIIVYKIHGTFAADEVLRARYWVDGEPGVIVTEDDYIDFLGTHDGQDGRLGVPQAVKALLTPSTLLFLGYSLADWDFRTIHQSLVGRLNKQDARKSFAVQLDPPEFWRDYWQKRDVRIVDMDVYGFCDLLAEKYFKKYPSA
jgi:hypothetical protein